MTNRKWIRIDILCDPDGADELGAVVAEAFGVGAEIAEDRVRFYMEGDQFLKQWELKLRQTLNEFREAFSPGLSTSFAYVHTVLENEDWADQWKVHFKPLRIARHFLVCPTWEQADPGADDRLISMDPGRAFGTGQHETTRLCLEWLEDWALGQSDLEARSLLDVGTGSGILAIAAALLDFGQVAAIDNDPEAVEVAGENILLNRLTETIQLRECTVSGVAGEFDVVVANIQALPLIEMAPDLGRKVKSHGRLVLSGILVEQKEGVQAAYEKLGWKLAGTEVAGEWCLLVFAWSNMRGTS